MHPFSADNRIISDTPNGDRQQSIVKSPKSHATFERVVATILPSFSNGITILYYIMLYSNIPFYKIPYNAIL